MSEENKLIEDPTNKKIKIGYVVGLQEDDTLIFNIIGDSSGLINILGIHKYAEHRVKYLLDNSQITGDRLIHEVGKGLKQIMDMLDILVKDKTPTETNE